MQDLEHTIRDARISFGSRVVVSMVGCRDAHWLSAQREVLCASLGPLGRVTATAKKKPKAPRGKVVPSKRSVA